jgi:hypothetical protein
VVSWEVVPWGKVASLSNKTENASLPGELFAEISCQQALFPYETAFSLRYPLRPFRVKILKNRLVFAHQNPIVIISIILSIKQIETEINSWKFK